MTCCSSSISANRTAKNSWRFYGAKHTHWLIPNISLELEGRCNCNRHHGWEKQHFFDCINVCMQTPLLCKRTARTCKPVSGKGWSKLSCGHRRWGRWRGRPAWGTASQRERERMGAWEGESVPAQKRHSVFIYEQVVTRCARFLRWDVYSHERMRLFVSVFMRMQENACVNAFMCGDRGRHTEMREEETGLSNKIRTVAAYRPAWWHSAYTGRHLYKLWLGRLILKKVCGWLATWF